MLILPAIDIRHGSCVRLFQGREDQETVYSEDPVQVAQQWKSRGARMLHVVDLDGAFAGKPVHLALAAEIRREVDIPIELGGGFRDLAVVQQAVGMGIDRIILGTSAIRNPELVRDAVSQFGSKVTVSIDVAGTFATAAGWKEVSGISFANLARQMRELGVRELLFTDTHRDGTLQGPNVPIIKQFLEAAQLPVIVSGGITTLEDIARLKDLEGIGLKGIVIGKALYDQRIQLEDAIKIA